MGSRIATGIVLLSLVASPSTAGPLLDSGVRHAHQIGAVTPIGGASTRPGDPWLWSGVAVFGAGILMEILSVSAAQKTVVACVTNPFGQIFCAENRRRNDGLMIAGVVTAVVGGFMVDFGRDKNRRAEGYASPTQIGGRIRVSF